MSFTTYLSIDVATKSLAIGLYRFRSFVNISGGVPEGIAASNAYCDESIQLLHMNVFDINDGAKLKDTSAIDKACSLKRTLIEYDTNTNLSQLDNVVVLIEYQMNANHCSNAVFNMIVYHYAGSYPIHVVKPSLKNTIALHPSLALADFLAYASSNYKANKQHTTYNMLYLLTLMDKRCLISQIKKKNYDDIADTLCQALAWHKHNC